MPPYRLRGHHHRKPSATTRLSAVASIGLGVAIAGAIAPGVAHAATEVQWDRVAQCESGGNWHADTGNGYFGGLQFAASTWSSFDVEHYAARANEATREQQIDVANHVLAREGWSAWPVCSKSAGTAGTTDHDRAAHVRSAHQRAMAQKHHRTDSRASTSKKSRASAPAETAARYVTVHQGDTLSSIARAHDIKGGWRTLYRDNRAAIGPNPAHLRVGMRLAY